MFAILAAVTALRIGVLILWDEPAGWRPGAVVALRPELPVPRRARREFASAVPLQMAASMQGGLYDVVRAPRRRRVPQPGPAPRGVAESLGR